MPLPTTFVRLGYVDGDTYAVTTIDGSAVQLRTDMPRGNAFGVDPGPVAWLTTSVKGAPALLAAMEARPSASAQCDARTLRKALDMLDQYCNG